jgi:hypothetical protein
MIPLTVLPVHKKHSVECASRMRVVIVRNRALKPANWPIADFVSIGNRPVSQDCKDCAYSAQSELQRDLA